MKLFSLKRKPTAQNGKVTPNDSFTAFDHGEAVILDLKGNRFYGLNETATFILREMRTDKALSAIEQEYRERYDLDEAIARRDIVTFREALIARHLLPS